jgi:hypothetical protein
MTARNLLLIEDLNRLLAQQSRELVENPWTRLQVWLLALFCLGATLRALWLYGTKGVVLSEKGILNSNLERRAGLLLSWADVASVSDVGPYLVLQPNPGVVCPVRRRPGILGYFGRNTPMPHMLIPSSQLRMRKVDQLDMLLAVLKIEPKLRSQMFGSVISSFLAARQLSHVQLRQVTVASTEQEAPTVVGFVKARDSGCRRAFVIGGTEESMELAPLVGLRESGEAGR